MQLTLARYGVCEVLQEAATLIQVRDGAGHEFWLKREALREVKPKPTRREKLLANRLVEDSDAEWVAFLRAHGTIAVQCPEKILDRFLTDFEEVTGYRITRETPGVYCQGAEQHWGLGLYVYFPATTLAFPVAPVDGKPGYQTIWNNNLVWSLLALGLPFGPRTIVGSTNSVLECML